MNNHWPRWAGSLEVNLCGFLVADSPRAYRTALACTVCVVLATSTLLFVTGPSHQRLYPCDQTILLDAGSRILSGEPPHVGFLSLEGCVAYLPVVLGMLVAGPRAAALAYGPALLLPILTLWTWWFARQRLAAVPAMWLSLMVGGLIVATYPLGCGGWRVPSYAMQYNRLGWSLVCMLALAMLVEPRRPLRRCRWALEGAAVGVLAGLLFFLKLNYAGATLVILGAGSVLYRRGAWFWLTGSAASLGILILYGVYMGGDFAAYFREMWGAFQYTEHSQSLIARVARVAWASLPELWVLGLILFLHMRPVFAGRRSGEVLWPWLKAAAVAAICVGLGIVVGSGNAQGYAIPVFVLAAVALAESFGRLFSLQSPATGEDGDGPGESLRLRVCLGYLAATVAGLCFLLPDLGSLAHSFLWKTLRAPQASAEERIHSPAMAEMLFPRQGDADPIDPADTLAQFYLHCKAGAGPTPYEYAFYVNDGLDLLRNRTDAKSRVFSLGFCNPFPFALQLPAPQHAPPLMYWGIYTDVPPERMFGNVTHLMIPKFIGKTGKDAWEKAYGAYLHEHYAPAAESALWILWLRKCN